MVKLLLVCASIPIFSPIAASAADFSLTIGPPVAAGTGSKVVKKAAVSFAVRLEQCAALDKARISGTAEGVADGARRSVPVMLIAAASPGVFLVSQDWPEGVWVVNLSATCGSAKAGAVVPIGPSGGFLREGLKVWTRPATKGEVEAALKALEK